MEIFAVWVVADADAAALVAPLTAVDMDPDHVHPHFLHDRCRGVVPVPCWMIGKNLVPSFS